MQIIVNDDDSFEYQATIYNPRGETFTGAFLRRGDPSTGGEILATLFSDVTLGTQYIQLRGTVVVSRTTRLASLAEELREHPRAFSVSVQSTARLSIGAIRGRLE